VRIPGLPLASPRSASRRAIRSVWRPGPPLPSAGPVPSSPRAAGWPAAGWAPGGGSTRSTGEHQPLREPRHQRQALRGLPPPMIRSRDLGVRCGRAEHVVQGWHCPRQVADRMPGPDEVRAISHGGSVRARSQAGTTKILPIGEAVAARDGESPSVPKNRHRVRVTLCAPIG